MKGNVTETLVWTEVEKEAKRVATGDLASGGLHGGTLSAVTPAKGWEDYAYAKPLIVG